jgi:tetratricopeptide (TPR) repeat protein
LAEPCLLPELRDFGWEQVAFIDTETTGLSTGTGTYVFLLGIGSFIQGVLTVRQYFLPSPDQESDFWPQVMAELGNFPVLASFNGKSYDLPLINNRLTLMGLPQLEPMLHLDLLYPARRLWRKVLPSCALKSLEEHRLDWRRQDDVAGALIPALYFDYLQSGDHQPLAGVFVHNCRDIVSLFELTAQMSASCADPAETFTRAEEFFGLADTYLRTGQVDLAVDLIVSGLERPGNQRVKHQYLYKLAKLHVRTANYQQALLVWSEIAGLEPLSLTPHVELAKLYEHRLRDLGAAWRSANQAALICHRRENLGVPVAVPEREELSKRLERLESRLSSRQATALADETLDVKRKQGGLAHV